MRACEQSWSGERRIRPLAGGETKEIVELFQSLSPESRYRRFLAVKTHLTAEELSRLSSIDGRDHIALVLEARDGRSSPWHPVGVARSIRIEPGGSRAEVAIAVSDAWQHRGVGHALLERLAELAREAGVRTWVAVCDVHNADVLHLLDSVGARAHAPRTVGPGVLSMEYQIAPTAEESTMTDESIRAHMLRDHAALEASLAALGNAAEGANAPELMLVWRAFENELRAHLAVEEESMFPLVSDEEMLDELHRDHAAIRRTLEEIGIAVELHAVRKESIDRFAESLRAHAASEDALLYRLADERLDVGKRRTLLDRVRTLASGHRRHRGSA